MTDTLTALRGARYPVRLEPDIPNGTVVVTYPDVPDASTFGHTREEALRNGLDALLWIFDGLIRKGCDVPSPSRIDGESVLIPDDDTERIERYLAERKRRDAR